MVYRDNILFLSLILLFPLLFTYAKDTPPPPLIPNETCTLENNSPRADCLVITLAHKGIFDIDIYDQTCNLAGWTRSAAYSKKAKVSTTLTKLKGRNWVHVTPQGMQGTLQPRVQYAGKTFGDDGMRGRHDRDSGSWVCTVDFGC